MTEVKAPPEHRSVSQMHTYERCPYAYYLGRIKKVWRRPAAWLAQGTAEHEVFEVVKKAEHAGDPIPLEDAKDLFRQSYAEAINEAAAVTPNFEYWFASGPYGGQLDIERRYNLGLEQIERFYRWEESHPEEVIWVAEDGTPGIEIDFDIDLDGVLVRGYIDLVLYSGCGDEFYVRDYKTGNHPGDDFQLGVYSVAISEQYGGFGPSGDYWMGRTGKPTYPFDLTLWTRERVTERFHELDGKIRAGDFPARPDPKVCNFCDVAASCEYAGQ